LSGCDLSPEPGQELGIRRQLGPDDLDGDRPAVGGHAQECLAQAVTTQLTKQPVGPDLTRVVGLQTRVPQFHPEHQQGLVFLLNQTKRS
jgi:hypothetical protein